MTALLNRNPLSRKEADFLLVEIQTLLLSISNSFTYGSLLACFYTLRF
jgi:hypothetical protein